MTADIARSSGERAIGPRMIEQRMKALGIDAQTRQLLQFLRPEIAAQLEIVARAFYEHFAAFPEVSRLLPLESVPVLRQHQKKHWLALFEARFDEEYCANAVRIGQIHFARGISPRLYLAGISFFHCRLIEFLARRYVRDPQLPAMLSALAKAIALDTDLALSAYTRAYWSTAKEDTSQALWL